MLIYRASNLLDPQRTIRIWRDETRRQGLGEVFIASVESLRHDRVDPTVAGFNASVEFQPDWSLLSSPVHVTAEGTRIFSYRETIERMLAKPEPAYRRFACVATGWDNTARRLRNATVLAGTSPDLYEGWLRQVLARGTASSTEAVVFVNAWNEWAEGAHLEPCQRWGRGYLEATRRALQPSAQTASPLRSHTSIDNVNEGPTELWRQNDQLSREGKEPALVESGEVYPPDPDMGSLKEALWLAQRQMTAMRISFSWRITAPIRAIGRLLGRS